MPRLTGDMLADVVLRKGATASSLDGWGWRELKALPVAWYDQLARILTKVEDIGVWPKGLLDAYIAMIPKTDGDATPLGQRPLSGLPVVYRIWASARVGQLEVGFSLGSPTLFLELVVVAALLRLGTLLRLTLRRSFLVWLTLMFISLLLMSLNHLTLSGQGVEQFRTACLVQACLFRVSFSCWATV